MNSGLAGWHQVYGIFRKEFTLQSRYRLTILNRLLIGPIISSVTAGVLYAGFFRVSKNLTLGHLNSQNYSIHLVFGFLIHNYLNSGYYFLPNKIIVEWNARTLPLFWIAPCPRPLMIFGLGSVEILRCWVVSLVAIAFICYVGPVSWLALGQEILILMSMFALGTGLGFFRCCLYFFNEGKSELLDNAYMGFIFTACLYIPRDLLPKFLWPLCEFNPAYHAMQGMMGVWENSPHLGFHLSWVGGALVLLASGCFLTWRFSQAEVMERSFR
jgi:ABC-type polysaccharide/polyol phosphate export permease